MKANRIVWQWCSQVIAEPNSYLQAHLQQVALGVILAHQGGNMTPIDGSRSQEKTTETPFDPLGETKPEEGLNHKVVKDLIFQRIFDDLLVHVEIFHCWNSFAFTDADGATKEHDNGAQYLVCIGEILVNESPAPEEREE